MSDIKEDQLTLDQLIAHAKNLSINQLLDLMIRIKDITADKLTKDQERTINIIETNQAKLDSLAEKQTALTQMFKS